MDAIGLYEGTVAPAFMHAQQRAQQHDFMSKLPMRLGRVVRVHNPKDDTNRSKAFFEYDVLVEDGSENKPSTRILLPHCWMISDFGGAADFSRSTPRVLERDKNQLNSTDDLGFGSRVLVLMINASTFAGVILGGIQHTKAEVDDAARGHHDIWQFNGIRREVDKDGQYVVSFKGATKADGLLIDGADANASGTSYAFTKDGNWTVSTVAQDQFFRLDHANKIIDLQANKDLKLLSLGTFTWESKGDSSNTIGGNSIISVQGDIAQESVVGGSVFNTLMQQSYTSSSMGIDLNTPAGLIETSGLGVALGGLAAVDQMIKGTTYRVAETTLHAAQAAGFTSVAAALGSAGALLTSAGGTLTAVSTLHKLPVVGAVLGSTPMTAASAMIAAAGGILTALAGAIPASLVVPITTFEGAAASYLSLKNRLD